MALTLQEVHAQVDHLVNATTGVSYFIQDYNDGVLTIEYDNGEIFTELSPDKMVEPLIDGNILINGIEYRAYVTQQIKFNPEQE